jgi:hypothetical protein
MNVGDPERAKRFEVVGLIFAADVERRLDDPRGDRDDRHILPVPESGSAGEKRHIIPAAEVADVVGGRRQQDIHTLPAHQPLKPLDIEREHVPTSAFPAIHGLTAARARILPGALVPEHLSRIDGAPHALIPFE